MIYRSLECGCEAHIYEDGSTPSWDMMFCERHSGDINDELLEACKAARDIIATRVPPDAFDGHAARALVMVKDAIAKAENE